jgi:uncharacterized membrane protein
VDQTWFLLAIIPPFLWSMCNHIDKHLLSKYFVEEDEGVGALMIVSALASIIATPFLFIADPSVMEVGDGNFFIIALTAVLDVLLLWSYLKAMQKDDASNVILYYQLVPVLGILTGYIFLGEVISNMQMAAMGIVIFGTSIISFDNTEGKFTFKWHTVGFMLIACSCWAAELAIFKVVALEENPWRSMFWKHIVLVIVGVIMFALLPKYRVSFMKVMRSNSVPILGLNLANEVLYMFGTVIYGFAAMLAPVALVLLTETFQSIFVFVIAVVLIILWPKFATEEIERKHVLKKLFAIGVTGVGTYLLLVTPT